MTSPLVCPSIWTEDSIKRFLLDAAHHGVSDITIVPYAGIFVTVNGCNQLLTNAANILQPTQIDMMISLIAPQGQAVLVNVASSPVDFARSYVDKMSNREARRFRFNVQQVFIKAQWVNHVSVRMLAEEPPSLEFIKLSAQQLDEFVKPSGCHIICGETGSGKTTTLAGIIAHIIKTKPHKVVTYEAPIEVVYDKVADRRGMVIQSEVGHGIESFAAGVRAGMRQNPDGILVGEVRDPETIDAAISASNTGHYVFASMHAAGVAHVFDRVRGFYSTDVADAKAKEFLTYTSCVMYQKLLAGTNGNRVLAREVLVIDEPLRKKLMAVDVANWASIVQEELEKQGRALGQEIARLVKQGAIEGRGGYGP